MNASPEEIEAAARALHRFNAPRVGNDVESWDDIGEAARARWTKMATLALGAAKAVFREANTPVMEPVRGDC